jgi:H+/gluconate symporter-like permease
MEMSEQMKEEIRWKIAKKRVAFKRSLIAYLIVNVFLWCLWAFTGMEMTQNYIPWPLWCTLGWGIGIAFAYFGAYVTHDKESEIEKEYSKMR